jgi:dethiobiotin synthetase
MSKTFYITGTDTDAGKTWASVAIIEAIKNQTANKVIGMKPVASGCHDTPNGLRNDDALKLQTASNVSVDYAMINPYSLRDATAPEIAAANEKTRLSLSPILNAHQGCSQRADIVVMEGVGGWMAPLSADIEQVDLVRNLNCAVIFVVGLKLGCINHARLTERALLNDHVNFLGWIATEVDPKLPFANDYFEALQRSLTKPCLGRVFAAKPHALDKIVGVITNAIDNTRC